MRSFRVLVFSILATFSTSVFAATFGPNGRSVPNEVLIKVRDAASAGVVSGIEQLLDANETQTLAKVGSATLIRVRSRSKSAEALMKALDQNPNVEFVEPNYLVQLTAEPNDPSYTQLWGLENTGQLIFGTAGATGADIDAEAAWNVTTGSNAVVVGVVDTGVDFNHPDLAANMWTNPGGKGNAACAAGTFGYNAIAKTCVPQDDYGHGTHVAGTIGAVGNNGLGVTGVNWTTSIMALKFINSSGSGTVADAITAIDFAIQAKIDGVNVRVLSNSWGGLPFSKALLDVINKANEHDILFVASAGNSSSNTDVYSHYPSSYTTSNMIAVAATDNQDQLAWFSNWGPTTVHLAAPGVNVYSTLPAGGYGFNSGTSMAAPHVAGVAALVLAAFPGYTTAEVKSAILNSADPLPNLTGFCVTGGRLNAAKAVGGTPTPDFSMLVNPTTRTIAQGGTTSYTVIITPQSGFAGAVNLTVSGLPPGANWSFTPPATATTATLAVTTNSNTPPSSGTLTIAGTSGALTRVAYTALSVIALQAVGACPSFSVGFGPAMTSPSAVAIGDLNGDGKTDYAVADSYLNAVVVRYGRTFSSALTLGVGRAPLFVTTGDFNGDGRLDLASANSLSHDVSVLLANGSGGFSSAVQYSAGTSPFAVTTGDFNGDGRLDLAVANNGSSNVSILLGQGGGTFAAATHYAAGPSPFWITAADVDADGRLDLAVANFNGGTVSLLRGNGDGTFNAPLNSTVGSKPSSVAAGDFDGDGKTDLAISNWGSNNVSLLTGNGDGTFAAAVSFAVGMKPYSVAAGDLNGDGKLDLVTANSASNDVTILLGSGSGSFASALNVSVGYEASQARIGDLNDDGQPDVLVVAQSSQRVVYVTNVSSCALNCGALAASVNSPVGSTPDSVAAGDFNGDGKIDLAIVDAAPNHVAIHLGNGDGAFTAGAAPAAGSAPRGVAAADFNRDGRLDLAVGSSGSNNVAILLGNGDGTWQSAVEYAAGTFPRSVAVGDFNRDGKLDLAISARDDNAVAVLRGNGDGTFQAPAAYAVGTSPDTVAIGDFNGDGVSDLAVTNAGSANVSVLLGNPDGTFQAAANAGAGTTPRAVIAGDFNRDGKTDLAVANAGTNNVSFLAGNGNGTFQAAVNHATGTAPQALIAADLNVDGLLDLVTANNTSHDVSVLLAMDNGVWAAATNYPTDLNPAAIVSADFNRDGKTDIVTTSSSAASFSLLINTCPVPDLTVVKTHSGAFNQGGMGAYTITVSNSGSAETSGVVMVKDTLPQGLVTTAMTGTGWTCVAETATCTRSDALAAGTSYPAITLNVRIYVNAHSSVTNNVTVSGGGEVNAANDSASDPTSIIGTTDLLLIKTHTGSFAQGATGRTYLLVVHNAGGLASSGTVTVTDVLPVGLTATAMSGSGWSCNLVSRTCTRSDALATYGSYPPITITVSVAANAPAAITNTATVSGGGDASPANNAASDPTVVWSTNTCGTFGVPLFYSMGTTSLIVADFNHDGRPDVAAGSYSGVSVSLGAGDGTLLAAHDYSSALRPRALAYGDLDHDGNLDLVTVSDEYTAHVSVLPGQGDGSFGPAVLYDADNPHYVYTVEVADVDRDGNLDVVMMDNYYYTGSSVIILLGNGDGTLRAPLSTAAAPSAGPWTLADVNGDSILDLLFAVSGDLNVLLGTGDGTFQTAVTSPLPNSVGSITTGDFNGDGVRDVAAAGYDVVYILPGNGNGTFGTGASYFASYSISYITTADINGDGKLDVITSGYSISTLLGNGDGTLQTAGTIASYDNGSRVAVADFNADGRADLVYPAYNGVRIRLGGCPDLAITKTHNGNFAAGSTGIYTIQVTNVGGGASTGQVTVVDTLPAGLMLNWYYAYSWNCTQAGQTLTCTRTGTLSPDDYYPWELTITVNVSPSTPTSVTNVATLTAAGDTNPANNTASDPTTIVYAPDLIVSKSHSGSAWVPGQTGTYTITVGNVGTASTTGTVTVTDSLPSSLSPVSMSGPGWTCGSLSCSRSDALAPTALYAPITLTVTVLPYASNLTNLASVSGGGESNTYNNTAADYTRILAPPVSVTATATAPSQVTVSWYLPYGEPQSVYEVFRGSGIGSYVQIGSTLGSVFYDTTASPNTVYLYKVRRVEGSISGPFSSLDFASTGPFTDDPIIAHTTRVKAVHIEQLRTLVNQLRSAAGLTATTFTDPSLAGKYVKKIHITELRSALNEARSLLGLGTFTFNDSATIAAAHINDLRTALQ
jgi:uncharacterized repeat protein (TIGR01451 family)